MTGLDTHMRKTYAAHELTGWNPGINKLKLRGAIE
jgi:hypothetical protein